MPRLMLLACSLAACAEGLPNPYEVKDLRVIGITAEPPNVAPGETTRLTAYFFDPDSDERAVSVLAYHCAERGTTACLITNEPSYTLIEGNAPRSQTDTYVFSWDYQVPADALSLASTVEKNYGYNDPVLIRGDNGVRFIDAIKRVVVTDVGRPKNDNPRLIGINFERDGLAIDDNAGLTALNRGQKYVLTPRYDSSSLEDYSVVDFTGETLAFSEEASFTWSCSPACSISQALTFGSDFTELVPPLDGIENGRFSIHLVMRDGRGGEAVYVKTVRLLPGERP